MDNYCPDCNTALDQCRCIRIVRVNGMGPEAPIETNSAGGVQSQVPFEMVKSFPHLATLEIGRVIRQGLLKGYPEYNWKKIPKSDHINHALAHIMCHCAGDREDNHLAHAACRLLFALETK